MTKVSSADETFIFIYALIFQAQFHQFHLIVPTNFSRKRDIFLWPCEKNEW